MTIAEAFYVIRNKTNSLYREEAIETLVEFFRKYDGFLILYNRLYICDNPIKMIDKSNNMIVSGWLTYDESINGGI